MFNSTINNDFEEGAVKFQYVVDKMNVSKGSVSHDQSTFMESWRTTRGRY